MPTAIVVRANPEHSAPGAPVNIVRVENVAIDDLGDGPVSVDVAYSSINYKDALVLTGRPGVVRRTPLVAGIDLVGTVRESSLPQWRPGQVVLANGAGMSETCHGGLSQLARPPWQALVELPDELTVSRAAALGTAGYTAALSVLRLQQAAISSSAEHPILVTGATGGVGSVATMLLAHLGHHVAALTGRAADFSDLLCELGASEIVDRAELSAPGRPLQKQHWSGVIDAVGGTVLANALAQTQYGGTVTACGLAASADLPSSVMPFILRAVTLAGIDSVQAPLAARRAAWALLADNIDVDVLDVITRTVPLSGAIEAAGQLLTGHGHGRIVVDVNL